MTEPETHTAHDDHIRVPESMPGALSVLAGAVSVVVFLAIVVATPLIDWSGRDHPEAAAAMKSVDARRDDVLDGSAMRRLEEALHTGSKTRRLVTPPTSRARATLFGHYHEKLAGGRERWLFARQRLTAAVPGSRLGAIDGRAQARLVACLDRRLAAMGHELVVMLVPRKGLLAAEFLEETLAAPDRYALLRSEMLRCGVACPDLLGALAAHDVADMWYPEDSHWTILGSFVASVEVARDRGWEIPVADRATVLVPGPAEPPVVGLREAAGLGDLDDDGSAGQRGTPRLFFRDASGRYARNDADRRDPSCAIWQVGTSFSSNFDTDLHLEHLTGRPVRAMGQPSKGPVIPLVKACAELTGGEFPGRKVVWEVPAHFFICRQPRDMEVGFLARAIDELPTPRSTLVSSLRTRAETGAALLPPIISLRDGRIHVDEDALMSSGDGVLHLEIRGKPARRPRAVEAVDAATGRAVRSDWRAGRAATTIPLIDGDVGAVRQSMRVDGGHAGMDVRLFAEGELDWNAGILGRATPARGIVQALRFPLERPVILAKSGVIWFLSRHEAAVDLISVVGFDAEGREHVIHEPHRPARLPALGVFSARDLVGTPLVAFEIRTLTAVDPRLVRLGVD